MVALSPILCILLAAGDTDPESRDGAAIVAGPLTLAQVRDALRGRQERCAATAGDASGVVVLGWQISPDGVVSEPIVISTTLSQPKAENCLLTAVGGSRFPASDSTVTLVSYPFVFGDAKLSKSREPLPRPVIDALIAQRQVEVSRCGESDSSGMLELHWSVEPWGHVTRVDIRNTELSRAVVNCVLAMVSGWRFPPSRSREAVDVSYCFVFQPYGSDEKTDQVKNEVVSEVDGSAIEQVVASGQSTILACYDQQLASTPDLAVDLEVTWTIAPTGRVASASVTKRTLKHAGLERCLLDAISGWRFPAFTGEPVKVTYPFYFAPL